MSRDHPRVRITLNIPPDVLRRVDRIAEREGRSRSWVFTDAIERLEDPMPASALRLDESRRRQLQADLVLSPTERVLAAERTAREVPRPRHSALFVTFDRFEDYLDWKNREGWGRP